MTFAKRMRHNELQLQFLPWLQDAHSVGDDQKSMLAFGHS
jgi:hypothetical protein